MADCFIIYKGKTYKEEDFLLLLNDHLSKSNKEINLTKGDKDYGTIRVKSSSGVLQYPQEGTGGTGGERGRVESVIQGQKPTQTQENAPLGENVETPKIKIGDKLFTNREDLNKAFTNKEITQPQFQKAETRFKKAAMDQALGKLADDFQSMFTKEAVGERKPDIKKIYDDVVEVVKTVIDYYGTRIKSGKDVARAARVSYNPMYDQAYEEVANKKILPDKQRYAAFTQKPETYAVKADAFMNFKRALGSGEKVGFKKALGLKNAAIDYLKTELKTQDIKGLYYREMASALNALERAATPTTLINSVRDMEEIVEKMKYKDEINEATGQRKKAQKAVKAGKFSNLSNDVQSFLDISPSLVPTDQWRTYKDFMDRLSQRGEKSFNVKDFVDFTNELKQDTDLEIEKQLTSKNQRKAIYDQIESMKGEDAETIKASLMDDFDISDYYAEDLISRQKANPKAVKEELSEEEEKENRDALKSEIKQKQRAFFKGEAFNSLSEDAQDVGNRLLSITPEEMDVFNDAQLRTLGTIIDKLEQGWLSNQAWKNYIRPVTQQRMIEVLAPSIKSAAAGIGTWAKNFKKHFESSKLKSKEGRKEIIKELASTELYKIDELIGQSKDKAVYKTLVAALSNAEAKVLQYKKIIDNTDKILNKIKRNDFDSTALRKMYELQLEYESNGGTGHTVGEYVEHTIGEIKQPDGTVKNTAGSSVYGPAEKARIKQLYDGLAKDAEGNIDLPSLWNSLEKPEQEFLTYKSEIDNNDLFNKLRTAEEVYRGGHFVGINNHTRIVADRPGKLSYSENPVQDLQDNSIAKGRLSARAASSHERTGYLGPIRFDSTGDFKRNVKEVYFDYHMTPAIRTVFGALNTMEKGATPLEIEYIEGMKTAFENAINTEYKSRNLEYDEWGRFVNLMLRSNYQSVLASLRRIPSEFLGNLSSALIFHPDYMLLGVKHAGMSMNSVMEFTGSVHKYRVGRDTQDMINSEVKDNAANRLRYNHKAGQKINNFLSTNPLRQAKEIISNKIITVSDAAIGRPYWKGAFLDEFSKLTKESFNSEEFDSNPVYRKKFEKQIINASRETDYQTSLMINTASPLEQMQALRGHDPKAMFKTINNFVRSFNANEASTAWTALKSLAGNGTMTKASAGRVLAGVMVRQYAYNVMMMTSYQLLAAMVLPPRRKKKKT